jgi:hypothetical protein
LVSKGRGAEIAWFVSTVGSRAGGESNIRRKTRPKAKALGIIRASKTSILANPLNFQTHPSFPQDPFLYMEEKDLYTHAYTHATPIDIAGLS